MARNGTIFERTNKGTDNHAAPQPGFSALTHPTTHDTGGKHMPAQDSEQPAVDWASITPSDTAAIEPQPRGVYVGGSGDISAVSAKGNTATFAAVAGQVLPIQPVRINATGTTATGLVALY